MGARDKLRYAVLGDGPAARAVLEALERTDNGIATALISDDEAMADALARRYGVHLTKGTAELPRVLRLEAVEALCVAAAGDPRAAFREAAALGMPVVYAPSEAHGGAVEGADLVLDLANDFLPQLRAFSARAQVRTQSHQITIERG